ncbi:MAG: hypothetical protein JO036_03730 [Candidatus Eremiobacteraeota bacterium]|nr:hypothetical protein [Candidatus Eremiobacteraeota bacterium]
MPVLPQAASQWDEYERFFEMIATISGAFFIACLVVAQWIADRLSGYRAELLFGALVVAAIEFNAMVGSVIGLTPFHADHPDRYLTDFLQFLGTLTYIAPLLIFANRRAFRTSAEHLLSAVYRRDRLQVGYSGAVIALAVMVAAGVATSTLFEWTKRYDQPEALVWSVASLLVVGGTATTFAIALYFLAAVTPDDSTPGASEPPVPDIPVAVQRGMLVSIVVLLVVVAISLMIGAFLDLTWIPYFFIRWFAFFSSLLAVATILRVRSGYTGRFAIVLLVIAILKNPFWPIHFGEHGRYLVPDLISAAIFIASAILIATSAGGSVPRAPTAS